MKPIIQLPHLSVKVGGDALGAKVLDAMCQLRVRGALSVPTVCELTFADPPASFGGLSAPAPGASLRVEVRGANDALFSGEITAVEYGYEPSGARRLRLRAYDPLHRLRKRQPVRVHVQVTTEDLAREMAADVGLEVNAQESGPLWRRLFQYQQSDLDLLVEVAARCGLYLAVRGDVLHLITLEGIDDPIALELGDTLLEASIEVNSNDACRKVTASAWDAWRVQERTGHADEPRSGREVEAEAAPSDVGGSGERTLTNITAQDDHHADATAQAELDLLAAGEVVLWAIAQGDPSLTPGARIGVSGVDGQVAGTYVISAVTHTIDRRRGFVSEISSASPPAPPRERDGGLIGTLGIVSSIADPDSLGRVQVQLPAFSDIQSDWMGVVGAGAGAGKGLVTLPEVGDQVLVVAQASDLSQGLVLGGLHGEKAPPDWGIEGGLVKRFGLFTPGGSRLQFDDGHRSIRLQDIGGSYLELSPRKVIIHANTDLEIEAPGRALTVRAKTIDFVRG
ncbi:MAG: phage baseplate assembly protein V [Stellaceae bacterium]